MTTVSVREATNRNNILSTRRRSTTIAPGLSTTRPLRAMPRTTAMTNRYQSGNYGVTEQKNINNEGKGDDEGDLEIIGNWTISATKKSESEQWRELLKDMGEGDPYLTILRQAKKGEMKAIAAKKATAILKYLISPGATRD